MNAPKKKNMFRILALFLGIILILTDPTGYWTVHAQEETLSEPTVKQEAREQTISGEETVEPSSGNGTDIEEPQGNTLTEACQDETAAEQPQDETAAEQPQDETAAEPPQDETAAEQLQDETAAEPPQDETAAEPPQDETAAGQPQDETAAGQPQDETAAEPPQDETAAGKPQDETAAGQPQDGTAAEQPQDNITAEESQGEDTTQTAGEAEDIPAADTSDPPRQMTIRELKSKEGEADAAIPVPMYIEGEITPRQEKYSFAGGEITGIEDQNWDGYPYKFLRAEIKILNGASVSSYPINYYDEYEGIYYYSVAGEDDAPAQDIDIAYEVPAGAEVAFIFALNTKKYDITVDNNKANENPEFKVRIISGIEDVGGKWSANSHSPVKVELTYPIGYYVKDPPVGAEAVGIKFNFKDPAPNINVDENFENRSITYAFDYPAQDVTMTVVGDEDTGTLTYGLFDGNPAFQNREKGKGWWRKIDASGNYKKGDPWYGGWSWRKVADETLPADSQMQVKVVPGTPSKTIMMDGVTKTISGGEFQKDTELNFQYLFFRIKTGAAAYFMWPSPTLNLCYFPNGEDFSTGTPIVESFKIWDASWIVDPKKPDEFPEKTLTYSVGNGAQIEITVKKTMWDNYTIGYDAPVYSGDRYPQYEAYVKITNMKNSFYLRTQGAGSVQGPHYFRGLYDISNESNALGSDSYFLDTGSAEQGGDNGGITSNIIKGGTTFLDKLAIYNRNLGESKVPWAADSAAFFKFGITPKWGYTIPTVESYGKPTADQPESDNLVMTNMPIELKNKADGHNADLQLGKYSWFNVNQNRKEVSSFQYVLYMPVTSLTGSHDMRALDVKTQKIKVDVTNNTQYAGGTDNHIVSGGVGTNGAAFDLLENDKVIFNRDFKAPEIANKTFVGFTGTITAPDNTLLPEGYNLTLAKSLDNTVYFKPGDSINLSNYFRRDAAVLLDSWTQNGRLNEAEQERLNLLMFSANLKIKINLVYSDGTTSQGKTLTCYINKYLQDVNAGTLTYDTNTAVASKSVSIIENSNIMFSSFGETFKKENSPDPYTYYYNKDQTTSKHQITQDLDGKEIASVKYDRGLEVIYQDPENSAHPFNNIPVKDDTIYKTYDGSNQATIQFPTVAQSPVGKVLDYWQVEELNADTGQWDLNPDKEIRAGDSAYQFASGTDGNNKSIRLTAVWRDISPDSYISIPKNIVLTENNTNLAKGNYAGAKVTVSYQSVNGSDKLVDVKVLSSFKLALTSDTTKQIEVFTYDVQGNKLTPTVAGSKYAQVGTFGSNPDESKSIWFNTKSQKGNEIYQGKFYKKPGDQPADESTLFYISAAATGGGG
ncbi:hypothetical protein AALH30_18210 [Blautia pseudococcoides]|uniref:hypothetical protein n=1 Tax=Blautia pseudococcoides TaxID=1796616 RepID=UPI00351614D4